MGSKVVISCLQAQIKRLGVFHDGNLFTDLGFSNVPTEVNINVVFLPEKVSSSLLLCQCPLSFFPWLKLLTFLATLVFSSIIVYQIMLMIQIV